MNGVQNDYIWWETVENIPFYSYNFSFWRLYNVSKFCSKIRENIYTLKRLNNILKKHEKIGLLVWGKTFDNIIPLIDPLKVQIFRVEDGFIRSIGLGSRYTPPLSLVIDPIGIYYDSNNPSLLEDIFSYYINNQSLFLRQRAENIIDLLKKYNISKYNICQSKEKYKISSQAYDKKIIFAVGQVETDASIKYGSPNIKTNLQLLIKIKETNPDAYIIYKPHPDVIGKYRHGNLDKQCIRRYICNEIIDNPNVSVLDLIKVSDEVHTITSLTGFEALIRGKKVICYGQPFYSNYGLTTDIYPNDRRRQLGIQLDIQTLVISSLIAYPLYRSYFKKQRTNVEEIITEIYKLKNNKDFRMVMWDIISKYLLDFIAKKRRF